MINRATLDPNVDYFECHVCGNQVDEVEVSMKEGDEVVDLFGNIAFRSSHAPTSYTLHPCGHQAAKIEYQNSSGHRMWQSSGHSDVRIFHEPFSPPDYEHCPKCNTASVGLCLECR